MASGAQQPAAAPGLSSGGFAVLPEKHSSNSSLPSALKSGPHLEVGQGPCFLGHAILALEWKLLPIPAESLFFSVFFNSS